MGPVYTLAPGWDAQTLFSAGSDKIVAQWNLATQEAIALAQTEDAIFSLLALPGNRLVAGLQNGGIVFLEKGITKPIVARKVHQTAVFDFLILPDQNQLVASDQQGYASLWDLNTLECIAVERIAPKSVRTLILSPEGKTILAGASDGQIRQLTLKLKEVNAWQVSDLSVFRLLQSGTGILATGRDAHIRYWAEEIGKKEIGVPAHMYAINDLVKHPSGRWLISASMDKAIKIWEMPSLELRKVVDLPRNGSHTHGINRLLWHEGKLYSASDDKSIMEWEIQLPSQPTD